jgi:CDGSH-type Zn-finger protein
MCSQDDGMAKVEIKCTENGPNLIVVDGNVFALMCRCAASKNKPYCDGAHSKIGFKAEAKEIKVTE